MEWQHLLEGQNGAEELGRDPSPAIDPHGPAEAPASDMELGRAATLALLLIPLRDDNV